MKQIFERLRDDLSWYVDQREHMMMVLDCTDVEVAYVLKVLEQVEGTHVGDMFLGFVHEATDAESYVQAIMANVSVQLTAVNMSREQEGLAPWAPLPAACTDPRVPPPERIKTLLLYIRSCLPEGDHHIVLSLLPTKMKDREGYARVVSGLFPRNGLEPWMAGVRIFVRDDRRRPFLLPQLAREPLDMVLIYDQLDLDTPALTRALEEAAMSPDTPEPERMMALVQIAALDFSYQRYDESYKKWGVLFAYYLREKNLPMQALALCGAADVLRQVGKLPEAKERYQQGLAVGASLETLPVMLNLLLGIGEVCLRLHQWQEAEGYLGLAGDIARKSLQTGTLCDVLERQGIALRALGRTAEAQALWRASVDLSRQAQYGERAVSVLGHLIALYDEARMIAEKRAHEEELRQVRREIAARDAAHQERHGEKGASA